MTSTISKYMPRWLLAAIATALVLATVVGGGGDPAEAIDPGDTNVVYIADGTNFADALMGATIATMNNSPMLGVAGTHSGDVIPDDTAAELDRLTNNKANKLDTIYIFGGDQAVSNSVATQLGQWANDVQRIAGDSRWGTYAGISQNLPAAIAEALHAQEADNADTLEGNDTADILAEAGTAVLMGSEGFGGTLNDVADGTEVCMTESIAPSRNMITTFDAHLSGQPNEGTAPSDLWLRVAFSTDGGASWTDVSNRTSPETTINADTDDGSTSYADAMSLTAGDTYQFAVEVNGGTFDEVRCNLLVSVSDGSVTAQP